ncbi:hypothetical protein ACFVSN_39595 [Kitasatospora sp. NPDC057904]|uniref:hypothetical protein n=1 Tax=Kitasatospora sp. NPDC057904 TaxID=3346275 RepID=UPI0036D824C4
MSFKSRGWKISSAALVALLAGAAFTIASPASASHAAENQPSAAASLKAWAFFDPSQAEIQRKQKVLDGIVDQITEGKSEGDRAQIPGFSNVEVDAAGNKLRLYWKGEVSGSVAKVLQSLPSGVTVEVIAAKYSMAELHAARDKLIKNDMPVTIPPSPTAANSQTARTSLMASSSSAVASRITSMAPAADGSGLVIGYDEDRGIGQRDESDPLTRPARSEKTLEVKSKTDQLAGVETHVNYQPLSRDLSTRYADESPWFGGASLTNPSGGICSSGFAVHSNFGRDLLTSAYHCDGGAGGDWYTLSSPPSPINRRHIGTSSNEVHPNYDVVGIAPDSGQTGTRVYVGWVNDSTGPTLPVAGWSANNNGDLVCTDGGNSGAHCNVQIKYTDIGITGPNGIYRPDVDLAVQLSDWYSQDIAAADGDSGGPVISMDGSYTKAYARGTITANYSMMSSCPSFVRLWDSSKACYGGTYFVPISQILMHMNWTLKTG